MFDWISDLVQRCVLVHDIQFGTNTHHDISQWSQFRSLEFFPLVQVLVQAWKTAWLTTQDISLNKDIPTDTPNLSYTAPILHHDWTEGTDDLRPIQLIWQANKFREDRWLEKKSTKIEHLSFNKSTYTKTIEWLKDNELVIIDRDHFGNTKCLSKHKNGILGIIESLNITPWETISIERNNDEKHCKDIAYAVRSISDKTGEKCIWNGSSRWPSGEHLIECNYSIDQSGKRWDEMITLPLGTRLTINTCTKLS